MKVFELNIHENTTSELIELLLHDLECREKKLLVFANVNTLNIAYANKLYHSVLNFFYIVNDGVGVDIAAKILHRKIFSENLNGTDFIPKLFKSLPKYSKVFIYGSIEKNIKLVEKKIIKEFENIDLVGVQDGYMSDNGDLISKIDESGADIVIIGLGNPKQEFWIMDNYMKVNASIFIGAGAFFDFYSGSIRRAPLWIRKIRMEWVFRLILEPKRLWKRYLYGNMIFMLRIISAKVKEKCFLRKTRG